MEHRKEQWENRDNYIGKLLKIRYQTLSEAGVPIFPVGIDFREEWDIS